MLVQLAVACLVSWLLIRRWRRRHLEKLHQQLKISAPRLPLLGHLHMFLCSEEDIMKTIQTIGREAIHSGGISSLWFAHKLYINVADSEVADIIMKTCLEKDDTMKCFHIATGDGSIFAPVKLWRPRRKLLAPTFGMKNLNRYVEIFSKRSCILVEEVKKEITAGTDTISMSEMYLLYSFNAIIGSLGMQVNLQENTQHPLFLALDEVMTALIARIFQPWLYNDFIYKLLPRYRTVAGHLNVVSEHIHKVVEEKRKQIGKHPDNVKKDGLTRDDLKSFIDLVLESNVSDDAIREECIVLVTAASDTSAVSLGYITLMLARHPEAQEKVYQELKGFIGECDRPITPEDLPKLKYLDAFIRETLRLYSPVPFIVRKIDKNIELQASGVTLLPECGVIINIWAINRNPTYWGEDAEEFRPERFLDSAPRHPVAFATFSHGPRNCVGYQYAMMSLKTIVATLLSQYRIMPASDDIQNKPLRVKYDLMMRLMDNCRVRFEPRK